MKRNRFFHTMVGALSLGLLWAALPAAGQGPALPPVFGTPTPQVAVVVEPEENGYVVYAPISQSTADGSGSDDGAQLSLKLLVANTGASTLHLKKTTVRFAGPPLAASVAFETVRDISPNATATIHLQDNVLMPGVRFNFMLPEPPPHHVIIDLTFAGYNGVVTTSRPLAPHQNATPEGSYLFPAKDSDLNPGEFWGGASSGVSSHHTGDQRLDFDMGVARWNGTEWTNKHLGKGIDGTQNADYLVWGKPLYAVADGVVEALTRDVPDHLPWEDGAGTNSIRIRVGNEVVHYYHLRQYSIPAKLSVGDPVSAGQKVGEVGNTGNSDFPHLHFGVRSDPVGMPEHLRPTLFRDIHLIERTEADPDNIGASPWVSVDGKTLTWVRNLIWPSSVPPM